MKTPDEKFDRLLTTAARAPERPVGAAVFALEARVLGHWRAGVRADDGEILMWGFRRAAICAGVLALASLAWNFHTFAPPSSAELVADSAMTMGVEP